jgi:hypothetical protein
MAVTGTNVVDRLNNFFNDSTDAIFTAAQKLEAVNVAIDEAFPVISDIKRDSSRTLSTTTFEYTPTATPEMEWGFSFAYVTPQSATSEVKHRLRRIRQVLNGTTWTVIVPPEITSAWNGLTLHLDYNARVGRLSAVGNSVEMPMSYLWYAAAEWLLSSRPITGTAFDTENYERQVERYERKAMAAKRAARRGFIQRIPPSYEYGLTSFAGGRYGQNIVTS